MRHAVTVTGLPAWMDLPRLLGPGGDGLADGAGWNREDAPDGTVAMSASMETRPVADLDARLRGLGFGGHAIAVNSVPPLPRGAVRDARTEDARRRRDTTPGFTRPGTRLDEEGRWSLTPERLALALGRRVLRAFGEGAHVVDAGCGAGGNSIGLARAGLRVTAIEQDAARLGTARHNARVYGVDGRVRFAQGDALALLPSLLGGATPPAMVFLDPPWGMAWDRVATPISGLPLLPAVLELMGGRVATWAKLPPSAVLDLAGLTRCEAWFGEAEGDRRRVKFVLACSG